MGKSGEKGDEKKVREEEEEEKYGDEAAHLEVQQLNTRSNEEVRERQ